MKDNNKNKKKNIYTAFSKVFIILSILGIFAWSGIFAFNQLIGDEPNNSNGNSTEGNTENTTKTEKKKVLNVLFCGENELLTDTIIYAKYNVENGQISMMSVPRDTYVNNPYCIGHKINAIYRGKNIGPLVEQVEDILDVKIDYYVVISNTIVRQIVDAVGGIEVDVPIRMKYDDPTQNLHIDLKPGVQILDGKKAEQFIRFRKNNDGSGYAGGDIQRITVQQGFIKKFIATVLSPKNITNIPNLIEIASKNTDTNVTTREALKYVTDLSKVNTSNIISYTAAGEAKYIDNLSYFVIDEKETQKIIKDEFDKVSMETITDKTENNQSTSTNNQ
ncbi:MAG: LCP family protein [Clostridia bacterium]|nr:LCP family protein [Clostridia bacterium]